MGDNKHPNNVIILSVYIHWEGCANEVLKCLRGYEGVEGVEIDENHKVIVKGENVNPFKVAKRLRKKTGKHVELLHTNHVAEIVKQSENQTHAEERGGTFAIAMVLHKRMHLKYSVMRIPMLVLVCKCLHMNMMLEKN